MPHGLPLTPLKGKIPKRAGHPFYQITVADALRLIEHATSVIYPKSLKEAKEIYQMESWER